MAWSNPTSHRPVNCPSCGAGFIGVGKKRYRCFMCDTRFTIDDKERTGTVDKIVREYGEKPGAVKNGGWPENMSTSDAYLAYDGMGDCVIFYVNNKTIINLEVGYVAYMDIENLRRHYRCIRKLEHMRFEFE